MKPNIGIWIDTTKACLIEITGSSENLTVIPSGINSRERFDGEGKNYTRMGSQYMDPETTKERRLDHQMRQFLDQVKNAVSHAHSLYIIGPAQTRKQLVKLITEDKTFDGRILKTESADSMTDNQMKAQIRSFFETSGKNSILA